MTIPWWKIHCGDACAVLDTMEEGSVDCVVTSPPYWALRDYGVDEQIGLESTPEKYIHSIVKVFRCVWKVLSDDGTLWLNIGDTYSSGGNTGGGAFMKERADGAWAGRKSKNGWRSPPKGIKRKNAIGIPWRVALALQSDGWNLRQDIIWHKPNPMPESVTDRCTKAHEYIFLLSKKSKYFYNHEAIKEPALNYGGNNGVGWGYADPKGPKPRCDSKARPKFRNKHSVWKIPTQPFKGAHFATFPERLVIPCVLAGCPVDGVVLDPFCGSGRTGVVAVKRGRNFVGIDIDPKSVEMATAEVSAASRQLTLEGIMK